jgi:hypothetical protein
MTKKQELTQKLICKKVRQIPRNIVLKIYFKIKNKKRIWKSSIKLLIKLKKVVLLRKTRKKKLKPI